MPVLKGAAGGIDRAQRMMPPADQDVLGRPVDVLVMKDGSLLVSDDHAGAVYRVSYKK